MMIKNVLCMRRVLLNVFFVVSSQMVEVAPQSNFPYTSIANRGSDSSLQEISEYFKNFAEKGGIAHVKYLGKKDKLIFYAYPSPIVDFSILFGAAALSALAGYAGWTSCEFKDPDAKVERILLRVMAAFLGCGVGCLGYIVYKNHKLRNSFTPYLTFSPKGLKKYNEYVLRWKDVADFRAKEEVKTDLVRVGDHFETVSKTEHYVEYKDKFGQVLFRLSDSDSYLPVSYDSAVIVFNHCLDAFGNEKFRAF